jgi:hypothetical protein
MSQVRHTTISEATRRDIVDFLMVEQVSWSGRLEESAFLGRIWDLSHVSSTDARFNDAAGDIWQHRVNNPYDWDDDWVFHDERFDVLHADDELFVRFLAEMLHPAVRPDLDEVRQLANTFNEMLRRDHWELYEANQLSGKPVFAGRTREAYHAASQALSVESYPRLADLQALREHLNRIDRDLRSDPPGAIGSSKELVETVCKTILDDYDIAYAHGADLMDLYKAVQKTLALNVDAVPESARGSGSAVKALRALVTTVVALAELRNELGSGHGRVRPSPALTRHAQLAFNASVAISEFLLDTWHVRRAAGQ